MSVSPYTMDTLYRHGSIDYIPYDALQPIIPSQRNISSPTGQIDSGLDYSQSSDSFSSSENIAQKQIEELKRMSQGPITLYPKTSTQTRSQAATNINNNYNYYDSFESYNSPLGEMSGSVVNEIRNIKTQPTVNINTNSTITSGMVTEDERAGIVQKRSLSKILPKALISIAAIVLTLVALFKVGGKPAGSTGSFWSKLNPVNWFK